MKKIKKPARKAKSKEDKKQKIILNDDPAETKPKAPALTIDPVEPARAAAPAEPAKEDQAAAPLVIEPKPIEKGSLSLTAEPAEIKVPEKSKAKAKEKTKKPAADPEPAADQVAQVKADFALLFIGLTRAVSIVAKEPELEATEQEAADFDKGFSQWVALRAPKLQSLYPDLLITIPLINYGTRVAAVLARKKAAAAAAGQAGKAAK